ncbi:hypothetical protein [Nocardioides sp. XL1]|uniref:hypothetical protein n=1 Tax=Nocardioides sp. XL1 TaxID=2003120 RepID=UPI00111ECD20|nr:hypothetical protein [Nocardioides sp. XL1]
MRVTGPHLPRSASWRGDGRALARHDDGLVLLRRVVVPRPEGQHLEVVEGQALELVAADQSVGHVALRVERRHGRPVDHDRAVGAQAGDDRVGEPLLLLGELDQLAGARVARRGEHDVALEPDPGALGERPGASVAVGRGRRLDEDARRWAGHADRQRMLDLAGLQLAGPDQAGEQRESGAAGALGPRLAVAGTVEVPLAHVVVGDRVVGLAARPPQVVGDRGGGVEHGVPPVVARVRVDVIGDVEHGGVGAVAAHELAAHQRRRAAARDHGHGPAHRVDVEAVLDEVAADERRATGALDHPDPLVCELDHLVRPRVDARGVDPPVPRGAVVEEAALGHHDAGGGCRVDRHDDLVGRVRAGVGARAAGEQHRADRDQGGDAVCPADPVGAHVRTRSLCFGTG